MRVLNVFRRAFGSRFLGAVLVGVAVLGAGDVEAGAGKQTKITFVKGDVSVGADATFARAKRGQEVAAGKTVKTGEGARAELTFPDGSIVRVGPNATLKVEGAAFDGKTKEVKVEATLVGGQAWAKVAKLVGEDAQFSLKTNNAVAGVRGTVFRVNVDRDEATVVKVYNGAVAVAAPLIAAGDSTAGAVGPISSDRRPVEDPMKVLPDAAAFEQLLGKMMSVRIPKGKTVQDVQPVQFTPEEDSKDEPEWVRWNSSRDAGKDTEKSD